MVPGLPGTEAPFKMKQMRKTILILILAAATAFIAASCSDKSEEILWNPEWNEGNGDDDDPDEPDPEEPEGITGKPRYVWIDAAANFEDYANSEDNIKADMQKIKDAGFTDVIVDVRPTSGDVLFKSTTADPLKKVDAWVTGGYKWLERTATFDYLQAFIDAGHETGLRVNASINTFVGGYLCPYGLGYDGMLFREPERKDWATSINAADGITNTMDLMDDSSDYGPKFLNPANEDVCIHYCGELA